MIRYITSLFIVYFFLACGSSDSPYLTTGDDAATKDKTLGTWILSTSGFDNINTNSTQNSTNYILANLANRNIKHIDQLVSFVLLEDDSYQIANEDGLMEFIAMAIDEGIRVNLLINDKELFNKDNYEDSMKKVETIIDFNNNLISTKGKNILGIKFRVDLERSNGWAKSHSEAIYNYLYFLYQARAKIKREGSSMLVSVDVDDAWESGSYSISFNHKDKTFTQHILDTVDYITVLSFSRDVGGVMSKIEDELQYCKDEQLTNRIVPALAVSPIVNLSDSFYGLQDTTLFWSTLNALQREVEDDLRVPMIMIENFEYFDHIPPVPAN
ncbi:MAG: hypothetical protein JXQ76_03750 [Campylobacterales bacterium]|nr:hypothetical protein [Campylobacterales bacterium]